MAAPWPDAVGASIQGRAGVGWREPYRERQGYQTPRVSDPVGRKRAWLRPGRMHMVCILFFSTNDPSCFGEAARGVLGDGGIPGG